MINARTDCFSNLTVQDKFEIHYSLDNVELERVFRNYFGWLMVPLALTANIVTPIFIYVVYKAIYTRRVSRKCYILLLNRAISDMMSSLVAIGVCIYVIAAENVNRDVVLLIESVFIGSFWTATVSYVALSVLKLFVIWKPLHHRKWFTMKRCKHIIIFSWLFYVSMVSYAAGMTAMVKVPVLAQWSGCRIETCVGFMYRSRNFLTIVVYSATLCVFLVTGVFSLTYSFVPVILIKRGQRHSIKIKKESLPVQQSAVKSAGFLLKRQFPLWKMTLNIVNFTVMHLFYVIWLELRLSKEMRMFRCIFRLTSTDRCFLLTHFMKLMHVLAFIKYTLMLRIIFDPLLSFIIDSQLRHCLLRDLGIKMDSSPESLSSIAKPPLRVSFANSSGSQITTSVDRKPVYKKKKTGERVSFDL